ncbi:MAG: hypothetical protein ACOX0D_07350 [Sphaerochaeta sp.]
MHIDARCACLQIELQRVGFVLDCPDGSIGSNVAQQNLKFCVKISNYFASENTMPWRRGRLNEKVPETIKKTAPKAFQASLPNQNIQRLLGSLILSKGCQSGRDWFSAAGRF